MLKAFAPTFVGGESTMTSLSLARNQISSMDKLEIPTSVEYLGVEENDIESLHVRKNLTKLNQMDIQRNGITTLVIDDGLANLGVL
ncbi:hypothetical protein PINS_up019541 [Pythium insidiosum]|nr:hypothetical protein PINS_up019541 [Pythium insidiosum]